MFEPPLDDKDKLVWDIVHQTPALDVGAFVGPPGTGTAHASGVDALLTSSNLLREFYRRRRFGEGGDGEGGELDSLAPDELADLVWRQLFLDNSPLSEPCRVVLTSLGMFGQDIASRDLRRYRDGFLAMSPEERVDRAFSLANLEAVLYPVDCLRDGGLPEKTREHRRFRPVLALDSLFADWKESARALRGLGFGVKGKIDDFAPLEFRRFLREAVELVRPAALSCDWASPKPPSDDDGIGRLVREAAIPLCRDAGLAFMLSSGGTRPDGGARRHAAEISALAPLWESNPDVNFLLFAARPEQAGEAAFEASTRTNLLLCGAGDPPPLFSPRPGYVRTCLDCCGNAFHACRSGAEVLEELAGIWAHLRWNLGGAFVERYRELSRTGWDFSEDEIRADVHAALAGNAKRFLGA